ncbi:hypothetical protein CPHO_02895 [Corynebacterium phocae]|uniref:Uncharacterized protein n=1 Tax=Corynebacterium phocae TaxID=161895 RepID=A0A1L7D1P0_9CORY|nr:hypothetical protein [Corynebacterium phocae]APT92018.1 hypothetical protein CPHO_02895 [Corynebacterium phocae]KAA8726394.1 hypothetical protein F4V58_02435 [Corynebacterium phocae]
MTRNSSKRPENPAAEPQHRRYPETQEEKYEQLMELLAEKYPNGRPVSFWEWLARALRIIK